jgi:hypothetical protein
MNKVPALIQFIEEHVERPGTLRELIKLRNAVISRNSFHHKESWLEWHSSSEYNMYTRGTCFGQRHGMAVREERIQYHRLESIVINYRHSLQAAPRYRLKPQLALHYSQRHPMLPD